MLRFFKFSGPLQFAAIIILAFLFRTVVAFTQAPLLTSDLSNLVLAEKLGNGFVLYRDVLDDVSPLSALLYWLLECISHRTLALYYIVSSLLMTLQAFQFRKLCNNNDLLTEKGDVPALMYILTSSICFDFLSLSPVLISLTFVLPALNNIFRLMREDKNEAQLFLTGFYIGLAFLTYAPSVVFFGIAYLTFLTSTRTTFRGYMLYITGFLFPIISVCTFFYLMNGLGAFAKCYILNIKGYWGLPASFDINIFLFIIAPTILICATGVVRALAYRRFIIYQVLCQRIMFLYMFAAICTNIFFSNQNITAGFLMAMPFVAFFNAHFFLLITRKKLAGYILLIYFLNSARFVFSYLPINYIQRDYIDFAAQVSEPCDWNRLYENKKILVIGTGSFNAYRNNSLATPYFNRSLASEVWEQTNTYSGTLAIFKGFSGDWPEVIIDEENKMQEVFKRVPLIAQKYKNTNKKGVYILSTTKQAHL